MASTDELKQAETIVPPREGNVVLDDELAISWFGWMQATIRLVGPRQSGPSFVG